MSHVIRVAFALTLFIAGATASADVSYSRGIFTTKCDVHIHGEIQPSDVEKLKALPCEPSSISLESKGGDVDAAMEIGRWLRKGDRRAMVMRDCMSSCALIFIGAVHRMNFGRIGLHRPYLAGPPRSPADTKSAVPAMYDQIREYVEEMGITPEFAHIMLNTPPSEMRVFQYDIVELVPESDPLWDELHTAEWASILGITTEEYRRREKERESCGPLPVDPNDDLERDECRQAIIWGLSRSVYRARSEKVFPRCLGEGLARFEECQRDVMAGR